MDWAASAQVPGPRCPTCHALVRALQALVREAVLRELGLGAERQSTEGAAAPRLAVRSAAGLRAANLL